jgi:hypothetical protein
MEVRPLIDHILLHTPNSQRSKEALGNSYYSVRRVDPSRLLKVCHHGQHSRLVTLEDEEVHYVRWFWIFSSAIPCLSPSFTVLSKTILRVVPAMLFPKPVIDHLMTRTHHGGAKGFLILKIVVTFQVNDILDRAIAYPNYEEGINIESLSPSPSRSLSAHLSNPANPFTITYI